MTPDVQTRSVYLFATDEMMEDAGYFRFAKDRPFIPGPLVSRVMSFTCSRANSSPLIILPKGRRDR